MIARLWRGHTRSEDADAYQRVLQATGVRDTLATPGNLGVWMLRNEDGGRTEFLLLTLWRDRAAIAAFAGNEIERARYYEADDEFLLDFHRTVEHFDVGGWWDAAGAAAQAA